MFWCSAAVVARLCPEFFFSHVSNGGYLLPGSLYGILGGRIYGILVPGNA